jgi:hypothetical protein
MAKMVTLAGGSPHTVALHTWFREAELDPTRMIKSTSTTSYSTPEERKWWGSLHKERIEKSNVREKFLQAGVTEGQLAVMGQAMLDRADDVDGTLTFIQYEVICQVRVWVHRSNICARRRTNIRTVVVLWKYRF